MKNRLQNTKGNMTIELSIMFPIFCIIAMAFIFYMHGKVLQIGMGAAAREGAREYSLNHSYEEAQAKAQDTLDYFHIDKTKITYIRQGEKRGIAIERPYTLYIPFGGKQEIKLGRSIVFQKEPKVEEEVETP